MRDSLFMRRFQRFAYAATDVQRVLEPDRSMRDPLRERLAIYKLQHQETRALRFLQTMNRGNAGIIERGKHFSFALKSGDSVRTAAEFLRKELDRHVALQLRI